VKISNSNPLIKQITKAAFPEYRGRKFRLEYAERVNMASYWSGGSRDTFVVVRLSDCKALTVPPQSAFDPHLGVDDYAIPAGFVVVCHSYFCGSDVGITIYARRDGILLLETV
jgi:hypothetical protein